MMVSRFARVCLVAAVVLVAAGCSASPSWGDTDEDTYLTVVRFNSGSVYDDVRLLRDGYAVCEAVRDGYGGDFGAYLADHVPRTLGEVDLDRTVVQGAAVSALCPDYGTRYTADR